MRKPTERLSPLASSSRLRTAFSSGIDGQDQEDRRLGQRAQDGLRLGGVHLTENPTESNIVVP
jgi:hypothetical protein